MTQMKQMKLCFERIFMMENLFEMKGVSCLSFLRYPDMTIRPRRVNKGAGNGWNVTWSQYEGATIETYRI